MKGMKGMNNSLNEWKKRWIEWMKERMNSMNERKDEYHEWKKGWIV